MFIGLCFIAKAEGIIEHQMYSITLKFYVILLMMLVVVLSLAKRIKSQKSNTDSNVWYVCHFLFYYLL